MLAPDSVTVPDPVLATPPLPARAAATEPSDKAKEPDEDRVPFWMVPPPDSVTPPFCVCVVPPRSSVPPATAVELAVAPSVPLPEIFRVPPFTAVLPP